MAVFPVFSIIYIFLFKSIYTYNIIPRSIESILQMLVAIYILMQKFIKENKLVFDFNFFFVFGILLYFSSSLTLFSLSENVPISKELNYFLWNIHATLVMILYMLIAIGYYKLGKEKSMNIYFYVITGMVGSFLLVVAMMWLYVRFKKNMLRQQFRMQTAELNHQKQLTKVIIESQESERKQIGKELHDDVGNSLASLRLFLDEHLVQYLEANVKAAYTKRIDAIFHKVRTISHQLSIVEIEMFGLREAIFILAENISVPNAFEIKVEELECEIPDDLEYTTSVIIYRVLQELLTNTIKHANAHLVNITFECIEQTNELIIHYQDDGIGLSSKKKLKGMGFKNIESRLQIANGRFEISNAPIKGFGVTIFVPLRS